MNTASETVARPHVLSGGCVISAGGQKRCSNSLGFKSQYRGKHVFKCAYFKGAVVIRSPNILWHKVVKKLMSRRIGKENVKTQQEAGAVCCEASQKEAPQMAAESHKGKHRV